MSNLNQPAIAAGMGAESIHSDDPRFKRLAGMAEAARWNGVQAQRAAADDAIARIYAEAAAVAGKSAEELKSMALSVFASMLYHSAQKPGKFVWSVCRVGDRDCPCIDVEVDLPPRGRESK